jgi:hypothetical protein
LRRMAPASNPAREWRWMPSNRGPGAGGSSSLSIAPQQCFQVFRRCSHRQRAARAEHETGVSASACCRHRSPGRVANLRCGAPREQAHRIQISPERNLGSNGSTGVLEINPVVDFEHVSAGAGPIRPTAALGLCIA